MQSRWKPALTPDWRPPSGDGWTIAQIPADIAVADNVRKAWHIRTRKTNKNGTWAVNEMAIFLHANGVAVGKEVRALIENQADFEWCGREQSRCHKKILLSAASKGKTVPEQAPVVPAIMAAQKTKAVRVVSSSGGGCRSCGGGRIR